VWERPKAVPKAEASAKALPKVMPAGWEEFRTDEGAYYYFHKGRGITM
jgi:hypothetical protein